MAPAEKQLGLWHAITVKVQHSTRFWIEARMSACRQVGSCAEKQDHVLRAVPSCIVPSRNRISIGIAQKREGSDDTQDMRFKLPSMPFHYASFRQAVNVARKKLHDAADARHVLLAERSGLPFDRGFKLHPNSIYTAQKESLAKVFERRSARKESIAKLCERRFSLTVGKVREPCKLSSQGLFGVFVAYRRLGQKKGS